MHQEQSWNGGGWRMSAFATKFFTWDLKGEIERILTNLNTKSSKCQKQGRGFCRGLCGWGSGSDTQTLGSGTQFTGPQGKQCRHWILPLPHQQADPSITSSKASCTPPQEMGSPCGGTMKVEASQERAICPKIVLILPCAVKLMRNMAPENSHSMRLSNLEREAQ